jgi:death-on-curing protein
MIRYLTLKEALELHRRIIEQTGGSTGIRDIGLLESAVAQPRMTFGGEDLYSTLVEKASALCFSVVKNHPFVDGNKRVGHAIMETFLILNGYEITALMPEQEKVILSLAAGELNREGFSNWLSDQMVQMKPDLP